MRVGPLRVGVICVGAMGAHHVRVFGELPDADVDFATFLGCRVVLNGRNALDRARVEAAGVRYLGIGR